MRRFFKPLILSVFLLPMTYNLLPITSIAGTVDKIIVVVNGETITQAELDAAVEMVAEKIKGQAGSAEELERQLEAQRKEILNRMIEEKLILSEAKKKEIKVEDAEIGARLEEVKSRFDSEEAFNETLRQSDLSLNELRQRYTDQIRISKMVELEVRKKVTITPSETLNYYEGHKEDFKQPEQVRLKNMLIKPTTGGSDDESAGALAERIRGFLKAGEDFDELALKYSKGPNADRGGDLGFVKRGQMKKEIEDIVFNLDAGGLSEVIKSDLGYHIFKVVEKKAEGAKPLEEAKSEIEKIIYAEKAKEIYNKWMEELKKNAYISYK